MVISSPASACSPARIHGGLLFFLRIAAQYQTDKFPLQGHIVLICLRVDGHVAFILYPGKKESAVYLIL